MRFAELKKNNEAEAEDQNKDDETLKDELLEDDGEEEDGDATSENDLEEENLEDDSENDTSDDDPEEDDQGLELFEQTGEEEAAKSDDAEVRGRAFQRERRKGQKALKEKNAELERLQKENEALRVNPAAASTDLPPMPKEEDFYDDSNPNAFNEAMEVWRDEKADIRARNKDQERRVNEATATAQQKRDTAMEEHLDRVDKLVSKSDSVTGELYEKAEKKLTESLEAVVQPGMGEAVFGHFVELSGEGSEKVIYHLGVNAKARDHLLGLMKSDPNGLKAAVYIGKLGEKLTNPKQRTSKAPKPTKKIKGDAAVNNDAKAGKKQYDATKGMIERIRIKRAAKKAGVDTSGW